MMFFARGVIALALCVALMIALVAYARSHPPDVIDHTPVTTTTEGVGRDRLLGP